MKPRKAGLFALAKVAEKQDRADNVTGHRRQQNCHRRNKERKNDQGFA